MNGEEKVRSQPCPKSPDFEGKVHTVPGLPVPGTKSGLIHWP
jgi:hypothetical protein